MGRRSKVEGGICEICSGYKEKHPNYHLRVYSDERCPGHYKEIDWTEVGQTPRFINGVRGAKYRKLDWSITEDEYIALREGCICFYCKERPSDNSVALDRKDNTKGYHLDNVVTCCGRCNKVKNNILTFEEMVEVGKILQRRKK